MSEITLTINGRQVKGKEEDTVLEICQSNGIDVPTLCHFEGLSDVGACRMCVVEIEKERRPVPACTYSARDGLVVKTDTEQLEKYRRLILELMLSEHKHDCSVCESDGHCELQDLANRYGIDKIRFPVTESIEPIDDSSNVIIWNPNICILCGRCIRACAEISQHRVLAFANRGDKTVVTAEMNELLGESSCYSCAACAEVCPTWAINPGRILASVNEYLCSGCGICVGLCPYEAITIDRQKKVAEINKDLCKFCGTCCAACPSEAIVQYAFTTERLFAEINAVLETM